MDTNETALNPNATELQPQKTPGMETPENHESDTLAVERKSTYQTKVENEQTLKAELSRDRTRGYVDTSKNRCFFYWKTKGSLMFVVFDPH